MLFMGNGSQTIPEETAGAGEERKTPLEMQDANEERLNGRNVKNFSTYDKG